MRRVRTLFPNIKCTVKLAIKMCDKNNSFQVPGPHSVKHCDTWVMGSKWGSPTRNDLACFLGKVFRQWHEANILKLKRSWKTKKRESKVAGVCRTRVLERWVSHRKLWRFQRDPLQAFSRILIGTSVWGRYLSSGSHIEILEAAVSKACVALGILPCPTRKIGKTHNSWGTGLSGQEGVTILFSIVIRILQRNRTNTGKKYDSVQRHKEHWEW